MTLADMCCPQDMIKSSTSYGFPPSPAVRDVGPQFNLTKWTIPDIPMAHMDTPIVVHYPHFSTSEVHSGLVDW